MMNPTLLLLLFGFIVIPFATPSAFAQTIQVNQTTPCFLNYTAGIHIWDNCGMDEDYLRASLLGFEWVTGGYFSLILAGIFILFTYIKYHKAIYPVIVGVAFIPLAIFLVPDNWFNSVIILMGIAFLAAAFKAVKNHTSDFS